MRWVHRSSFTIRVPPGSKSIRLPMPLSSGAGPSPTGAWVVDPDWFGTVVVETEGTNEGQADLQARCRGVRTNMPTADLDAEKEKRTVWRILRERRYASILSGYPQCLTCPELVDREKYGSVPSHTKSGLSQGEDVHTL